MTTDNQTKTSPSITGRKYASVADLISGENVTREVQDRVTELETETRITRHLASMRTAAGFTQSEMAERLNCSQSCISKWESGEDSDLTIKVITDYCRTTDRRLGFVMGKPMGHVEAIKACAFALRDRLKALAEIANRDEELEQSIQAFFSQAFFNLLTIFENCQREMPNSSGFEIRLEVPDGPSKRIACHPLKITRFEPVTA